MFEWRARCQWVAQHCTNIGSQTVANGRKRLQTVANDCKWLQTVANDRKRSQMVANIWNRRKWLQTITNGHKRWQKDANRRKRSQMATNCPTDRKWSQTIANPVESLATHRGALFTLLAMNGESPAMYTMSPSIGLPQQTRGIHPKLFQCWHTVVDAGPTLKQH